jgi:hypothetical protein
MQVGQNKTHYKQVYKHFQHAITDSLERQKEHPRTGNTGWLGYKPDGNATTTRASTTITIASTTSRTIGRAHGGGGGLHGSGAVAHAGGSGNRQNEQHSVETAGPSVEDGGLGPGQETEAQRSSASSAQGHGDGSEVDMHDLEPGEPGMP